MTTRLTFLHPQPPRPLPESESRVRSRFLEACAHNQLAKRCRGLEQALHYDRKTWLALEAARRDVHTRVLRLTTVERLASDRDIRLVGLVLVEEPHIGVHIPISLRVLTTLPIALGLAGGAA